MAARQRLKRYMPDLSKLEYDLQCEWGAECHVRSRDLNEFYRHLNEHLSIYVDQHRQEPNLTCQWRNCGHVEEFDTASFIRHVLFHGFHTKLKYLGMKTCEHNHPNIPLCQKSTENRNLIPDLPVEFRCSWGDCQFTNSHAQLFYEHVNQHAGSAVCRWTGCTHRTDKPYRIREHIRRHTQEKTIACSRCGSLFSCIVKFIEHCQLSTEVSSQFQCNKCAQQFQSKSLLQKHLNKHKTKHACPYCTQTFASPSGVKRHIIYRHTDIKYFQCPDCSLSFKCANSLTVHRRRLHLHPLVDKINDDEQKSEEKINPNEKQKPSHKYACHLCERRFLRGKKLTWHLLKVHQLGKAMGSTRLSYTLRKDGFFRVQSKLVPTALPSKYALQQQQQQQQQQPQPPAPARLPQSTCASFLINRLLHDHEDGEQHPPFSPEFELDNWDDGEGENNDDDDDGGDDDDEDNDEDDITDCLELCSKRSNTQRFKDESGDGLYVN